MPVTGQTIQSLSELAAKYLRVLRGAWAIRHDAAVARTPLERQFLPASLEILDTPAPALPRAVLWTIVAALSFVIAWAMIGKIDVVAVALGKVIAADKTKVIQPAETAIVKRILVKDGQAVKAGDILIELVAAATDTAADAARGREALIATRLESARYDALARASRGLAPPRPLAAVETAPRAAIEAESRAMLSQFQEHRTRLAAVDAEITKRTAELATAKELAAKLSQTVPIARRRAEDYKNLVKQNFISEHGYLEREQARIEQEGELAFHTARVKELAAAIEESRKRRESLIAEFERAAVNAKTEADKRAALLEQELVKARTREEQQILAAPVEGTVQQLAVHTVGGVVTPAQALMLIAPSDYQAEIEAVLENKDVGFVKVGQRAEVKVETFPFTRYGTLPGTVSVVSNDAVADEKKGLLFQARVKLDKASIQVDEREVLLSPGMAVTAEIAIGKRRVIEFFLDPIRKTMNEGLRER
jgi:membrane fusion protein, hemolysin D